MRLSLTRWVGVFFALAAVVAVALVARWATATVVDPPADPVDVVDPVVYTVEDGTLGREIRFNGFAAWPVGLELSGFPAGIVTELMVESGAVVDAGDEILSVDLQPVVLARGAVPAFRALDVGAEGRDVEQLQQLLVDTGFYDADIDGKYGPATRRAVRDWQRHYGIHDDGVVGLGEVVFVDQLPARVRLLVGVGDRIESADASALAVLADAPEFWIPLAPQQRQLIPPDAAIEIELPGGRSEPAVIASAVETGEGVEVYLGGVGGAALCSADCEDVSVVDQTPIGVTAEIVATRTGPVVPLAAIESQPTGDVTVTLESGEAQTVTVVTEDRGLAIVEGIEAGSRLLLVENDR